MLVFQGGIELFFALNFFKNLHPVVVMNFHESTQSNIILVETKALIQDHATIFAS